MGSGVIYYEYEKCEKFEDYDMDADAELGTFKIRRYHFDDESFIHPLHSVRFDPDRPYEIPIEPLMADKILSTSKDEKSSTERLRSSRRPSLHYSPRTMPVAQRERSTSSIKGTCSFRRGTTSSSLRKPRSWELIPPSEGWMCDADDEKEIGGMEPSVKKEESGEEDPEMEEEESEEEGNPEDRIPATLSLPIDIDTEEDFQRYIQELARAPEPSPLCSSQASVPDEPVEAANQQFVSRNGSNYNLCGVWQSQSSSPSVVHGVENWGVRAAAEADFVLEAAGPSDRLPFQASERDPHFLWVYQELFTRLGVRLPFTDFQKEVMTRCWVAVNQLHLNCWGLLRTFEQVCLHFGFRPTSRLFLYIYDILIPRSGYGFISFRAPQGCKLFGIFEESIQEFKWHYFKVLPAPGRCAFWLDDGGKPFPWVYWNRGVKDFVIHELDPLEMAVFEFLVSLPAGLPKKNNLTCRWILDNNDAVVGRFLDDLLLVVIKKTKLDRMMAMMVDPTRMAPWSVLPTGVPVSTAAAAASSSAALAESSANPATPSVQVPRPPPATSKAKKSSSKRERPEVANVEGEEAGKEDPDADLKQKRRRKEKGKEEDLVDRVLGDDAAWEYAINPLDLAFPKKYNYRKALDAGLTLSSVWMHLQGMLLDQLLGESWRLQCQALACQQIGLEATLKAKTKAEEELFSVKDQLSVLKHSQKEVEHQSALERVAQLDEDIKVLKAQLESAQLSMTRDQKRAESAESNAKTLAASLETAQAELAKARDEANYWCTEWKSLGTEAKEMCQETLEIVLDQVSHLCHGVDFSAITLKTRWYPKGRRIHVPEELLGDDAEVAETLPEVVLEQQQQEQGNASGGGGGECPT
ncbi:hypothetical protein PIB30_027977 [Stylosanthes scabra]|uniref:Transposase (Putative), gypsy type n=1 Tax=Stylosanthes scabra TaxID=79078 RepID=A0ABU6UBU5_9FABA|nr:hypothetical protein [Stylosanthes scabra]